MDLKSNQSKEVTEPTTWQSSPLTNEDLERIEATLLPSLDRHHLRLLAHCLACFKAMAQPSNTGPLPEERVRLKWFLQNPSLAEDPSFLRILLQQFNVAGDQLEDVAKSCDISPLELGLTDLISASLQSFPSHLEPRRTENY